MSNHCFAFSPTDLYHLGTNPLLNIYCTRQHTESEHSLISLDQVQGSQTYWGPGNSQKNKIWSSRQSRRWGWRWGNQSAKLGGLTTSARWSCSCWSWFQVSPPPPTCGQGRPGPLLSVSYDHNQAEWAPHWWCEGPLPGTVSSSWRASRCQSSWHKK